MHKAVADKLALELLAQARLPATELASRTDLAQSPDYWARLNPALSVGRARRAAIRERRAIGPRRRNDLTARLAADGYFQVDGLLPAASLQRMGRAVEALRRADWPPVFAFVYDQFWQVTRVPSLVRLLSAVLGRGYRQIPHAWCFYVPAHPGAAGWPPHIDGAEGSSRDHRLTLWVPFDDATLDNGCMYVVPRRCIAAEVAASFPWAETVRADEATALLRASRALPARAGTVLGWDFNLIHWGATCGDARRPRVSLSVEFLGAAAAPDPQEKPLLEAQGDLPPLAERLWVIAKAILAYQRFDPAMIRYLQLAKRLAEAVEGKAWPKGS